MPTFRTKPIEIQAIQWRGNNQADVEAFGASIQHVETVGVTSDGQTVTISQPHVYDHLQDVWVPINPLDYIIKGTKGEYYPCEVEVFNWKYELVDPRHG
jgi:hypothetical protein